MDEIVGRLESIGLDRKKAAETSKNDRLTTKLLYLVEKSSGRTDRDTGVLYYTLASKHCGDPSQLDKVLKHVMNGEIKTRVQVEEALMFLDKHLHYTDEEFQEACGIGVDVGPEDIQEAIGQIVDLHKTEILEGTCPAAQLIREIREVKNIKWANGQLVKEGLDQVLKAIGGRKTTGKKSPGLFRGELLRFHKPGENQQLNDTITKNHLQLTGGKVVTRFPPEPNGFLHIGHAKAINVNFRYSEYFSGITYLRYDDTNPEGERLTYLDRIKEDVEWLGFQPYKITHASDYFPQLYRHAVSLIHKGLAYVCHQTPEEINLCRGGADHKHPATASPWRNRPISESLALFEDMKNGRFEEGKATLRLKMDIQSGNPFMWDLVAYRVLHEEHIRTGTQWCIYHMYDFAHCLCDSIENITHSFCTTEFILAREAYYWICDALEVYKPVQWEYGRLNLTGTVLSKRKLAKLVEEGAVNGWDDPRLFTISGLRRRGFTAKAINRFIEHVGVTTNTTTIDLRLLDHFVREDLNETSPRVMAVLDPLLVIIEDLAEDHLEWIEMGSMVKDVQEVKPVPMTRQIYIDRSDFRAEADGGFYRLTAAQPVGLFRSFAIQHTGHVLEGDRVVKVFARVTSEKPLAFIQWVASSSVARSPLKAEVRLYSSLFKGDANEPGSINPDSLDIQHAFVDVRARTAKSGDRFQFQRIGYFCVDPDSSGERMVFNRTLSLKEDFHMNK